MQIFLKIAALLAIAVSFTPGNCSPRPDPCRVAHGPNPSLCLPGSPRKPTTKIIPNGQHHSETVLIYPGGVTLTLPIISPPAYPKYFNHRVQR